MSAIAGVVQLQGVRDVLEEGRAVMEALEKYPADDIQVWSNEKIFLGCHAQWITPESVGERLPYYDSESKCTITADAMIDNRKELFEKLDVKRQVQKEITDSELILLAYKKWGEDSPQYLLGDFAFMIWDEREQKLFGARDHSGYRTLYYYKDCSRLVCCTTIEPILAMPGVKKRLNENWVAEFLALSLVIDTVDATLTPYDRINQVPPFHSFTFKNGQMKVTKYGKYYFNQKLKFKRDEEYVEAFQDVFKEAVQARLRTHRNVGSHLSGGLDSGAVVGVASPILKRENKELHTYSYIPPHDFVDFTSKQYLADERPLIQKTVEYLGGIRDHYCDFEGLSSYTEIDGMLEVNEMPYKFIENSFWLKGTFKEAYHEDIGILLNGDVGNSTISWGDAVYHYSILLKRFRWITLLREINQFSRKVGGARYSNLPIILGAAFPKWKAWLSKEKEEYDPRMINTEFAKKTKVFEKLKQFGIDESGWPVSTDMNEQRKCIYDSIYPYNASNTLYSKLSLKYRMWKRDPTNDLRVVRFCFSLPDEQFVRNGYDRALIRRSTQGILPDEIRLNQKTRGIQAADWIHRMIPQWDQLMREAEQLSVDKRIQEFINSHVLQSAIEKGLKGPVRENISDPDYKILLRSIVLYRFLQKF